MARFFGYSNDLLAILDDRGFALVVSPSFQRLLGYEIPEITGRPVLRLVHPADRKLVRARVRQLSPERPVVGLDAQILQAGGGTVPTRWSLSMGPQRRIYAVGHDRTDEARRKEAVLTNELAELRLQTAMELHDGILQTLTGASLQVAVARRLLQADPEAAEGVLADLAETIAAEQQEMRLYVDEVKGQLPVWTDARLSLQERLSSMLDRVRAVWGLTVSLDADLDEKFTQERCRQVLRVIQEATVNAARHGAAKTVSVRVGWDGPELAIQVEDDGQGFPFVGELDSEELYERRLGPLSLKHRVGRAGGRIAIRSTRQGARVSIWLPTDTECTP